jgi:hypothetical protein
MRGVVEKVDNTPKRCCEKKCSEHVELNNINLYRIIKKICIVLLELHTINMTLN